VGWRRFLHWATLLLVIAATAPPAAVAASDAWTSVALPLPAGTTQTQMDGISCPETNNCTAVAYATVSGTNEALAFEETNGNWQSTVIPTPSGPIGGHPAGAPDELSCSSAGNCVALGTYPGPGEYMVAVEDNGSWSSFDDSTSEAAQAVACQPNASCTVVGEIPETPDDVGQTDAFAGTITGNSITGAHLPVPAGTPAVAPNTFVDLFFGPISCPATGGNCTAVGLESYTISTPEGPEDQDSDFVAVGSGTSWTTTMLPTPGAPASGSSFLFTGMQGLSCPTAASCIVDGAAYNPSTSLTSAIAEAEQSNGSYTQQPIAVPASKSGTNSFLTTSGCIGAGDCVIGGHTFDPSGNGKGFVERLHADSWSYFTPPLPADASASPNQAFPWVDCSADGLCAATGAYTPTGGGRQLALYTGSGTSWQVQSAGIPTSGTLYQSNVSCAPDGGCAATGFYGNGASSNTPYIFTTNPALSVSVSTPMDAGAPDPKLNDTVPVTITVTAGTGNQGNVTGISFTGGAPLSWTPPGALTSTDGSNVNPASFSLTPGASHSFTVNVSVAELGSIALNSAVTGTDSQSNTVSAAGSDTLTTQGGLVVTVQTDQNPIQLANDPSGTEIPKPLTATIQIQNPLGVGVSNVKLTNPMTTEKETSDAVLIPVQQHGDPVFNSTADPSGTIGTIGAGETVSVTVPLQAVGDGKARIDALATYDNPFMSGTLTSAGSADQLVNPTLLAKLSYRLAPGEGVVKAGTPFSVLGTLTNLTNAAVLHFDPLMPDLTGNVGGTNPFDIDKPFPPVDEYVVPWAGDLGGADQLSFQAVGQTVPGFGTRATISYTPTGTVDLPDGTSRKLTDADILDTAPAPGQPVSVSIDDSVAPPSHADPSTVVANFTLSATVAAHDWLANTFSTVKSIGGAALGLLSTKHILSLVDTAEYLVDYYRSLTPAERDAYFTQVASDILEQTDRFGNTLGQVKSAVVAAVQGWENRLLAAWEADDWNAVAAQLGATTSNVLLEAGTWFVGLPGAKNVVKAADAARAAEDAAKVATSVDGLIEGENLLDKAGSPLRTIFGLDDGQVNDLIELAKDKAMQIAIRFRNSKSAYWIEQFGALPKPEAIKIKTVNQIDYLFLGYRRSDEALAVFKRPITRQQLALNIQRAGITDQQLVAVITKRWIARSKEWKKYLATYRQYEQTGITLGFDYAAQGISSKASVFTRRAFKLEEIRPDYFRIQIANNSGALKLVTGDIDSVAMVDSAGNTLDEAQRIDGYENLEQIIDAQHGATFDWIKDGEFGHQTQRDLLADHDPGKQLVAVFDPAGRVTAQYIDPALTVYNKTTLRGRITFRMGYRMPDPAPIPQGIVKLPPDITPGAGIVPGFESPSSWGLQGSGSNQAADIAAAGRGHVNPLPPVPALARCRWQFDRGRDAALAYPLDTSRLEVWRVGNGWHPINSRECGPHGHAHDSGPLAADRVLHVLPESSLSADAATGASRIQINSVRAVVPGLKQAPWFEKGDTVVIDPGQSNQETGAVASVTPFRLRKPLHHAHEAGEMIAVYAT
jgi:hypothetical protein